MSETRSVTEEHWGDEEIMAAIRSQARLVAREEVASLMGLLLRRLQDMDAGAIDRMEFSSLVGEALADFSGDKGEPGE